MKKYHQLTSGERYELAALRRQGLSNAEIARALGRHRSTIGREFARNTREDGGYRPSTAQQMTNGRRSKSRRGRRFTAAEWKLVETRLAWKWSPEQIAGRLEKSGELDISHETIYRYVWRDRSEGGFLYRHLRCVQKKRRKRYRSYDSRGRLADKRTIAERPLAAEHRARVGHLEGDTMLGGSDKHCALTLVDRKTGYLWIGKLRARTAEETNERTISLIRGARRAVHTITVDNGTEFHSYRTIERATGAKFYFATPHQAWERGTCENTIGLIRQYLPKRTSMKRVSQLDCSLIARQLNHRPRKRLGYLTPAECYERSST
jgi:IS30 family transposase